MKKVTLFFLFTLVILILPKTVLAAEIVSDYFIDAYIGEDGSMLVNELIVPKGEFNGYSFEKDLIQLLLMVLLELKMTLEEKAEFIIMVLIVIFL